MNKETECNKKEAGDEESNEQRSREVTTSMGPLQGRKDTKRKFELDVIRKKEEKFTTWNT